MSQLDHVILFCAPHAPEADTLHAQGLLEGSGQSHIGQGTVNRRFFFTNFYLELVWVENESEARSDLVRPTQLWERWKQRGSGVCPFGLVFRPGEPPQPPPFPTWSYRPLYLPPDLSIEVGIAVKPTEPLLFYLPFAGNRRSPKSEPINRPVEELVKVLLHLPQATQISPALESLISACLVSVQTSPDYIVELTLQGATATDLDLRPHNSSHSSPAEHRGLTNR